jgi:uncharacterized membrane protein
MGTLLAFHLVGMVMWIGGLMFVSRLLKIVSTTEAAALTLAPSIKRMFFGFVVAGLVLSTLTGVLQISLNGFGYYMAQAKWFHPKLTLVVVLYVLSFLLFKQVSALQRGQLPKGSKAMMLHGVTGLVLIAISFLMEVVR